MHGKETGKNAIYSVVHDILNRKQGVVMEKTILAPGIILYRTGKTHADFLLEQTKTSIGDMWKTASGVNTETLKEEFVESRKCYDFPLFYYDQMGVELKSLYFGIDSWINEKVNDFVSTYSIEKVEKGPYIFLKYGETDKFDWHIDDGNKFPRTVSVSAYLNDDYEGGEIEFKHFGISHKPKAGDIIVFGASFSYLHRVKPVKSGTRYAVVNWYRYNGYPQMMGDNNV